MLAKYYSHPPPSQMDCYCISPTAMHKKGPENGGFVLHGFFYVVIIAKTIVLSSPGGTGVLWWLYAKQRKSPKETVLPEQLQIAEDNLRALLIYAISATVFTVSIGLGVSFRSMFLFTRDH